MATERFAIAPEVTEGTNPGTGFVFYPFTSADHGLEQTRIASRELRGDRNPARSALVGRKVNRGINFDLHLQVYNALIAGLFGSTFSTTVALTAQSIGIGTVVGQTATLTATAGTPFTNVVVGQWIKIGGFTNAGNNGYCRVTAKTSALIVDVEGLTFVAEAGTGNETVNAAMIRVGSTQQAFSIEKQFPDADATGLFETSVGNIIDTMTMRAEVGSLINGTMGFVGRSSTPAGTTAAGTPASSPERDVLGPITGITQIREGSFQQDTTLRVNAVGFDWNNQTEQEEQLAALGPQKASLGQVALTGSFRVFTKSTGIVALKQKEVNGTPSKLSYRLVDTDGYSMIVTFPRILFNQVPTPIPGDTGPRYADATFQVEPDATSVAAQIDYFAP